MILMHKILGRREPPNSFKNFHSLAQHMNKINPDHNWSSDILIIEAKKVYKFDEA